MSLFIFTLSALWWLVRDGWRPESWWTVTSWKWMSLKVEHAAAVDTQFNSVHCGTLGGSIQRVRITWHYKTWNRHHFSIGRDINGSLTYSMHLGPDGHCFDSIRLFMPPNLPPVQHTNRCPGLLWGLSVWPLSHFAAMMRHFLEPTLNTFVKKFLPWQFRHCSQGYWSISQKCAMKNLQN